MRDDLLYYYERELTYLRRMGAEFAGRYPKVAGRLQLERDKCEDPHVERLLEGFAFWRPGCTSRSTTTFRDQRVVSQRRLSALCPPAALDVAGRIPARPRPGQADDRLPHSPRHPAVSRPWPASRASSALLRYGALAAGSGRRLVEDARPSQPADQGFGGRRRTQGRAPVPAGHLVRQAGARYAPAPPERRGQPGLHPLRAALQQLRPGAGAGPHAAKPDQAGAAAGRVAPAGGLRRARGDAAVSRPVLPRRIGCCRSTSRFPQKFLFFDLAGFEHAPRGGLRRARRVRVPDLAVRAGRPSVEARDRGARAHCPAGLHAGREPVLPDVRARPPGPAPARVQACGGRAAAAHHRDLLGRQRRRRSRPSPPSRCGSSRSTPIRHGSDRAQHEMFWYAKRRPAGWRSDKGTDVYLSFVDLSNRVVHPDLDAVTARLTCFNRRLAEPAAVRRRSRRLRAAGRGPDPEDRRPGQAHGGGAAAARESRSSGG